MTTLKSECRKFSPNIFNKTKCQNCFRTKDAHSAEALESNRATRKVSKCGYLFVAPDWDFSVSINRTKRWQRRWFVLYDDGELTYSVDEHPDTVPQAVIDMNKVLEVSDAEDVTGNQFAIAITAPEKVHFVKGTSREESKWWFDVLSRFPRNTIRGKHKRNATFPGGKATTTPVTIISDHEPASEQIVASTDGISRPRFLSTSETQRNNRKDWSWLQVDHNDEEDVFPTKDTIDYETSCPELPIGDDQRNGRLTTEVDVNNALNKLFTSTSLNSNNGSSRPILQNKLQENKNVDSEIINTQDTLIENKSLQSEAVESSKKARCRRYQKRENRGCRNQRSRSDGVAKMIPGKDFLTDNLSKTSIITKESYSDQESQEISSKNTFKEDISKSLSSKKSNDENECKLSLNKTTPTDDIISTSKTCYQNPSYSLNSENTDSHSVLRKSEVNESSKHNGSFSPAPTRKRHTSNKEGSSKIGSSNSISQQETHRPLRTLKKSESLMNIASESAAEIRNRISELKRYHSYKGSPSLYRERHNDAASQGSKAAAFISTIRPVRDTDPKTHVQNDSSEKGANSTPVNSAWQSCVDICTEDMFLKKGWLLRQTLSKEWSRHWFVLRNSSLTYFRDPSAEDCGILDGVLDLNQVTSVEELDSDKYFPFCLTMWDNKKHILSAVTAGIRSNWIQAIRHASDLWDSASRKDFCKDEIILPEHTFHGTDNKNKSSPLCDKSQHQLSFPSSPIPCLDTEKVLDVSSSDDQSEYFSIIDDDEGGDRSSSPRALPPSPPVNRTAMSLVKERARTRSNSYSHPTRQNSFSSVTDSSEIRAEQHSDETNSDNSTTAQDSPLWQRKKYYQDICSKLMQSQLELEANRYQCLKDCSVSPIIDNYAKDIKCEASGNYRMRILQKRCKDLENQLAVKSKEINDKALELDAFSHLKTCYQDLIEQNKCLRKKLSEGSEMTAIPDNGLSENYQLKYEILKMKYLQDRAEWENKLKKEKSHSFSKEYNFEGLMKLLLKSKHILHEVKDKLNESECPNMSNTLCEMKQLLDEIERVMPFLEKKIKRDSDTKKLRKALSDLQLLCDKKQQILLKEQNNFSSLKLEIEKKDEQIQELQQKLQVLKETALDNSHLKGLQAFDDVSIPCSELNCDEQQGTESDMCGKCRDWKLKFESAREKILLLKKELKDSHALYDDLEIVCFKLKQELKNKDENHKSQIALMTARVDDLTSKFTLSERNLRQLKQKLVKAESRQERRRSSLKNKDSLTLSKEYEAKLFELERKILSIEGQIEEKKISKENDTTASFDFQPDADETCLVSERQLHKRLSQDSNSGSENTSLLLRLHTLSTRVKSATETVEKQPLEGTKDNENLERPKICLQVRNEEENSAHDECGEDWSTLSYATSLADLQTIDGFDGDFPCSLPECLECLNQKAENMLLWVKTTLCSIQKQDSSLLSNSKTFFYNKDAMFLISEVIEILDSLFESKLEEISETLVSSEIVKIFYKILLIKELTRTLHKVTYTESKIALERVSIIKFAFKLITEHILKTDISKDYVNKDNSNINICIEMAEKLISLCDASYEGLQNYSTTDVLHSQLQTNRLELMQELLSEFIKTLQKEKEFRLSALWQIVTDVPVQDTEKETSNILFQNYNFHDADPLFSNIIFLVNSAFYDIKKAFSTSEYKYFNILQCEYEAWNEWNLHIVQILDVEHQLFVEELRNFFSRAGEVSVFCSNFSLAMYQKIVFTIFELLQVVLAITISQAIFSFPTDNKTVDCNQNLDKNWITLLLENYHQQAVLLTCEKPFASRLNFSGDCSILNCILEIGAKEIEMAGQMDTIQHLYEKKLESLQKEVDYLCSENEKLSNKDCEQCKEKISEITRLQNELEQKSKEIKCCQQCNVHKAQFEAANQQHSLELSLLQKQHKDKIDELHKHLQLVLQQKDEIHLQEVQKLEDELQSAHKRLKHMEEEYDEQIQNLRELYEQKLCLRQDAISEESVRQRYQTEIEELKCLCEKGLTVLENSHKRITMELERRHKQELTMLEAEKEKVLAEETQATLTALEVMRKAHAEELQREIAKFKEEFMKKMQTDFQAESFFEKQGTEIEEIKREILSISEKYSVKCLESASLEERVQSLCHQLQEANHQLFDLMARNKQLKVHLAMDIAQKRDSLEGKIDPQSAEDLKVLLQLKESELAEYKEINAQLKQELYLAQMHVNVLDVQCEQLQQSLKAERRLQEDDVSSLRTKLDAIISASSVGSHECIQSIDRSYRGTKLPNRRSFLYRSPSLTLPGHILELASARVLTSSNAKELLRSPSCPRLQNSTS